MIDYLKRVWKCRHFWLSLVRIDLRARYRRSVLGMGWSLAHPIIMTAVLCTVFHKLFGLDLRDYAPYLLSGLCFWAYLTHALNEGCQSIYRGETYIRQYPAPVAIYALRTTLAGGFHFLMALMILLPLTWVLRGFSLVNLVYLLYLLPTLALLLAFGWAAGVLAGVANVYFPDFQHLCEMALMMLFYLTPILYTPELLRQRQLDWLVNFNPLASFLELLRAPLVNCQPPSATAVLMAVSTTALCAGLAVLTLARKEKDLVFRL